MKASLVMFQSSSALYHHHWPDHQHQHHYPFVALLMVVSAGWNRTKHLASCHVPMDKHKSADSKISVLHAVDAPKLRR
jgi:hypothetical protein